MADDKTQGDDRLVAAYDRMMERARDLLHKAREGALPSLQQRLEEARDKAVELGELTREEAQSVADHLRRDLRDAAEHMESTEKELGDWLRFDLELIEDRIAELFSHMVDHTRAELDRLALEAEIRGWHSGEISGPGTLYCANCGQELHFHATGRIPPCPSCHATAFHRLPPAGKGD